jgi:hypothetical protein
MGDAWTLIAHRDTGDILPGKNPVCKPDLPTRYARSQRSAGLAIPIRAVGRSKQNVECGAESDAASNAHGASFIAVDLERDPQQVYARVTTQ